MYHPPERHDEIFLGLSKLTLDENNQGMKILNIIEKNFNYKVEKTENQIIKKSAKQCMHCLRNILLPYESEWSCFSCRYIVEKRKKWTYISRLKKIDLSVD